MRFTFTRTRIEGLVIIKPETGQDERGTFSETYKYSVFREEGIKDVFVQENRSVSRKGVLRGLHYQRPPHAQVKLVSCGRGKVFDVAADLRPGSKTFGQTVSVELSGENRLMFYIPAGFAHGFYALEDNTEISYKCSAEYAPSHDAGVRWDDPDLAIKWPGTERMLSSKDLALPLLKDMKF
ncbi:MAG: dTDP-4-dehydrorhamnose 3,5-epimerase [Elusimicrobia bacterium RIFOXYA2_FULL_58_8]|nr:MAG: dTDP-4-dehydrorhamnose 3,5-epimerase [Elusimicrobia bacterium RIFOXYA2_FULL_58_8]